MVSLVEFFRVTRLISILLRVSTLKQRSLDVTRMPFPLSCSLDTEKCAALAITNLPYNLLSKTLAVTPRGFLHFSCSNSVFKHFAGEKKTAEALAIDMKMSYKIHSNYKINNIAFFGSSEDDKVMVNVKLNFS